MATAIKMPDLGTNVQEIRLIEWLKQEGDPVKRGDPLCEVETDKATDQLESVAEGILLRQVVPAGSEIPSGAIIAYVGQAGESVPEPGAEQIAHEEKAAAPGACQDTAAPGSSRARVSPVIRNLAAREGVDLATLVGTGPAGQITREDVRKAKSLSENRSGDLRSDVSAGSETRAERGSGMGSKQTTPTRRAMPLCKEQRAVARQVARSNREIPTIDLAACIAMSAVIGQRQQWLERSSQKVAYDAFFIRAAAQAIRQFPVFAGHADDEHLFPHQTIDICFAVDHEDKLFLPVVRSADKLSLAEVHAQIERLVEKIRSGEIRPDDLAGGCFTVSNLGMYPIDSFQMIIPPEQSGALAVGAIDQRPVVQDGQIVAHPVCTVVLSVDHRLINGALAAKFLKHLKEILET